MKTFIRFCLTGFGTGTMAGRAAGIILLILLSVVIIAWFIISYIWKLIKGNKAEQQSNQ